MKLGIIEGKIGMWFEEDDTKESRVIGMMLLSYIKDLSKRKQNEFIESVRNKRIIIDVIEDDEKKNEPE